MPRWTTSVSPLSRVSKQVLAESPDRLDRAALEQRAEVLGRRVAAHRAPVGHRHGLDLAPHHLAGQVLAQRLDLGQLRHRSSSVPGRPGGLLLGVLLGAALAGAPARAAQEHLGHVDPVVVRPRAHDHVSRRPLAVAHGLLLQPALVVEVVGLLAGTGDGVAQLAQHQALGGVPAGIEVDRAEDGLEGVGQDGGLGPAPGALLPRPSRSTSPTPSRPATCASTRALTTAERTLASFPSANSG